METKTAEDINLETRDPLLAHQLVEVLEEKQVNYTEHYRNYTWRIHTGNCSGRCSL